MNDGNIIKDTEDKNIENFLRYLKVQKNLSNNTVNSYRYDLEDFYRFLLQKNLTIYELNTENFELYLSELYKKLISPSSTNRKISAIKSYAKFSGLKSENFEIKNIKQGQKIPVFLTKEEISLMLQKSSEQKNEIGIKVFAILAIIYSTGMRVSEALSLKIDQINKNGEINIIGKGDKERVVFLNQYAQNALAKYMLVRGCFLKKSTDLGNKYLFCSRSKTGFYTRENFFIALKKLAYLCKIDENKVSPHKIRHSFATHLYNGGVNLFVLKQALGHSSISTTQIYTHLDKKRLSETISQHHPLSKNIIKK
jgi:integrase/recombinase XerD